MMRYSAGSQKEPEMGKPMEPIFALPLQLPPRSSRERLRSLHQQLRLAILEGRLQPGLRLPPTRSLAAAHGVSRNTVMAAYDLLLSEGYLAARQGAGTYVADVLPNLSERTAPRERRSTGDRRLNAFWRQSMTVSAAATDPTLRFDFRLGVPDTAQFPMDVWRRLSARALRAFAKKPFAHDEPYGRPTLREAIARYVSFARAVACSAEDITVTAGAQQAFDLLARILVTPGRTVVAVENPGYPRVRTTFAAAGAKIVGVPVDAEGLVVERIPPSASVVCVTPSHQFPLGVPLSARRRTALLEYAHTRGAVIIEDDYDGEFRFSGRPLDALQTLDRGESVFYIGTFSKNLFPALRLGFTVAPAWAQRALGAAKHYADWSCSPIGQETLATFIKEGHLARHVRRMRRLYGRRRELLLEGLRSELSPWLEPVPNVAGLHLTALAKGSLDGERLAGKAREHEVGVLALERFRLGKSGPAGLVFGYGGSDERDIVAGLARLRRACEQVAPLKSR
jgi:GntR family transcriptional regulator/MocR family aminotransferase